MDHLRALDCKLSKGSLFTWLTAVPLAPNTVAGPVLSSQEWFIKWINDWKDDRKKKNNPWALSLRLNIMMSMGESG